MPIDIIGGNSKGAYVSSIYATGHAKGWDVKTMIKATSKVFSRWHYHITPPITSMFADGTVIAIDVSPIVDMGENETFGDTLSGWDMIYSKLNPFAEEIKMPGLPTIMQRSAEIGAVLQLKGIVEKLTDVYISMPVEHFDILGFGEADNIVQVGYNEAQRRIIPWLKEKEKEQKKEQKTA